MKLTKIPILKVAKSSVALLKAIRDRARPIHSSYMKVEAAIASSSATEKAQFDIFKKEAKKAKKDFADINKAQDALNEKWAESEDRQLSPEETDALKLEQKNIERRFKRIRKLNDQLQAFPSEYEQLKQSNQRHIHKLLGRHGRIIVFFTIFAFGILFLINYFYWKVIEPDFGHNVKPGYYQAVAQLLPLLLVAIFLSGNKDDKKEKEIPEPGWYRVNFSGRLEGLFAVTVGEIACLIAIAYERTGTGLFTLTIFSLLMLTRLTYLRIVNGKID
jgi:hypothetical protein